MKLIQICFAAVMMIGFLPITATAQDKGLELHQTVIENAQRCAADKSGSEVISCYVKATPAKCESQVFQYFARRGDDKSEAGHAWRICVASCADAGFWSRSFGDCARDIY